MSEKKKTRRCSSCKKYLSLSEFYMSPSGYYRSYCHPCQNKRIKKRRKDNPEEHRERQRKHRNKSGYKEYRKNRHLKEKFGITLDEYNLMFLKQQGKCLICNVHHKDLKSNLGVDHDHKTGKVRGLLCVNCNIGIGYLKHDIEILLNAIDYLK